ncbi:hypothetical protein V8C34DRAFT_286393 [Trichoderma compactum]
MYTSRSANCLMESLFCFWTFWLLVLFAHFRRCMCTSISLPATRSDFISFHFRLQSLRLPELIRFRRLSCANSVLRLRCPPSALSNGCAVLIPSRVC